MGKFNKILLAIIIFIVIIFAIITYFYFNIGNTAEDNFNKVLEEYVANNKLANKISENLNVEKYEENGIEENVYSILNKDFYLYENTNVEYEETTGIKLLEYDNSNEKYAEIYYISYDYSTEPSKEYTLEITDELTNNLLLSGKNEEQVIGGMVSSVKIKKVSLDKKINFEIFEKDKDEKQIISSSKTQIDLEKDLEQKKKINQSDKLVEGQLGNVRFSYLNHEYAYFGTTSHAYSTNLVGENASLPVETQYGKTFIVEDYIEIFYNKNVNNLNLEEAFESMVLINNNVGQYGLSDFYGMDIANKNGEVIETVVINYEEMIKICKGLSIEKDGKKYTKDSFVNFAEIPMVKEDNVTIGNNINAIKYYVENCPEEKSYIFIHKDSIYNVKIPNNERLTSIFQQFLDSLQLVD